jgi:RNA polymerase sigma-70 factor, ECF subfamily
VTCIQRWRNMAFYGTGFPIGVTSLTSSADHTYHGDVVPTDADLFKLLANRSEYATTCLFDRYSRLVYSTALRVLHDTAAAEDVMQELFLGLWRRPPTLIPASDGLAGWFVVLARNRAISLLRKRTLISPIDNLRVASPFDLSREAEKSLLLNRVCDLMTGLPSDQQKALRLAFFDGLSHSQIANATGYALGTVKSRIRTALRTLSKDLVLKNERKLARRGLSELAKQRQMKHASA